MTDIVRHPVVIAVIVGIATFFVLNHFNPNLPEKKHKRKKCNRGFLQDPKEVNIMGSVVISMITWYYLRSKNNKIVVDINQDAKKEVSGSATLTKIDRNNLSVSENSSDAQKSYNLLGKGLQLPNGQVLPDVFHKIS